jgi:hypothetical protein
MVATITHAFVSAIGDDPVAAAAGQVLPSNWNAAHNIGGGQAGGFLMQDANSALQAIRLPGYLFGLTLSTPGSSATFTIAAGVAADSKLNNDFMVLAAGLNKTTSAWAVGSGNGGLDTGAIAASTWYHVWLIKRPDTGVVDALISLSATAPTMPANYTLGRRIGSLKTNASSQWILFTQLGDEFIWNVAVNDVNNVNPGTAGASYTLPSVPPNVLVKVDASFVLTNTVTANGYMYVDPPSWGSGGQTAGAGYSVTSQTVNNVSVSRFLINTNTQSVHLQCFTVANNQCYVTVFGWIDRRGRDN